MDGSAPMLAMLMLVMVQNVPGPPGDEATAVPRLVRPQRCARGEDEIIVCGGDLQSRRLEPLPDRPADPILPSASVHLSGGKTLTAHGEEGGGYTQVPRAMVTLKVPF